MNGITLSYSISLQSEAFSDFVTRLTTTSVLSCQQQLFEDIWTLWVMTAFPFGIKYLLKWKKYLQSQKMFAKWLHVWLCETPTLCSQEGGNAERWLEGLQTAPLGKASLGVYSHSGPHKQGSSCSTARLLPAVNPDGRHSDRSSCPPCFDRSHHMDPSHTHPDLQQWGKRIVKRCLDWFVK